MADITKIWPTVLSPSDCRPVQLEPTDGAADALLAASASLSAVLQSNRAALDSQLELVRQAQAQLKLDREQLREEVDSFKLLAMKEVEAERTHLAEVWRDLTSTMEREKLAMQGIQTFSADKIKLDVGGCRYATSLSTLTSQPESLLWSMFSGRFKLEKDDDGCYFLDRDGQLFGVLLNWLRDPQGFKLPTDQAQRELLLQEARYYRLAGLQAALHSCTQQVCAEEEPQAMLPGLHSPSVLQGSLACKVVVIGDAKVGKSALVNQFTRGAVSPGYKPTMGVEFAVHDMEAVSYTHLTLPTKRIV
eukprot:TRINITY_DN11894_c0_g1_i1.p1 TRINITY_DN11894_c0_g1~~TRINITY_DN11894_c0_g1_i1.p1  ORF type:complete len:304 (+),score=94.88 TRINITY_DN11894_c0_g1_i1:117-1028(+)